MSLGTGWAGSALFHGRWGLGDQFVAQGFGRPLHARDALLSELQRGGLLADTRGVVAPAQQPIHQLASLRAVAKTAPR